eukprot:355136-Chlamydomonas_euryale.AAC.7
MRVGRLACPSTQRTGHGSLLASPDPPIWVWYAAGRRGACVAGRGATCTPRAQRAAYKCAAAARSTRLRAGAWTQCARRARSVRAHDRSRPYRSQQGGHRPAGGQGQAAARCRVHVGRSGAP